MIDLKKYTIDAFDFFIRSKTSNKVKKVSAGMKMINEGRNDQDSDGGAGAGCCVSGSEFINGPDIRVITSVNHEDPSLFF